MRYLSNHLTYFDAICKVKHISRADLIGDQKFDNLKAENTRLWPSTILNIKIRDILYVQF